MESLAGKKAAIKHALRQQAKRRRRNTNIAAGNPAGPVPRRLLGDQPPENSSTAVSTAHAATNSATPTTMREVLASIPGFKQPHQRKRNGKKLSSAAQLEQTKRDGIIFIYI